MKTLATLTLALLISAVISQTALAAGYMKIGDIKGESQDKASKPTPSRELQNRHKPTPAGPLLPAEQKPRPPMERPPAPRATDDKGSQSGNVETEWKVEKGSK